LLSQLRPTPAQAQLFGGTVDFGSIEFSGGEIDFSNTDWSCPPKFSWDGAAPAGVKLLTEISEEPQ
jgi:hypothetical protein